MLQETDAAAGWYMGNTPSSAGASGGAYGLFIINSGSVASAGLTGFVNGTLAATWYFENGGIALSGAIAGPNTTVVSGSGVLVESEGGSGAGAVFNFTALLYGTDTETVSEVIRFNF